MDIFGIDSLFAQMVLALGLAMLLGNGFALLRERQGRRPEGMGELRRGRAWFLVIVGAVMALWGGLSLLIG